MSVLVNEKTRLIVKASPAAKHFHAHNDRVRHQRGWRSHAGKAAQASRAPRLQHCCRRAKHGANASSFLFLRVRRDAILEAADAELGSSSVLTRHPALDMVRVASVVDFKKTASSAELSRHHLSRQMQNRHHAGPHSQARKCRRRQPQRHSDYEAVHQLRNSASANPPASVSRRPHHWHHISRRIQLSTMIRDLTPLF